MLTTPDVVNGGPQLVEQAEDRLEFAVASHQSSGTSGMIPVSTLIAQLVTWEK
jgi:hypothetical protein